MVKQRAGSGESPSWFDPSQAFSDTQRVDLFDDPKWEITTPSRATRAADEARRSPRTTGWVGAMGRALAKRGRHSRHPA